MDFERLGESIGFQRTMRNLEVAATREINRANATITELAAQVVAERRRHAAEVVELQRVIRGLRGEPEPPVDHEAVARAARDAVLREPVRETRWWGLRRIHWRREEHRTVAGARRARARAAATAYTAANR